MTTESTRLWVVYHLPSYSDTPKFAGVFSSLQLAQEVALDLQDTFITAHILDNVED